MIRPYYENRTRIENNTRIMPDPQPCNLDRISLVKNFELHKYISLRLCFPGQRIFYVEPVLVWYTWANEEKKINILYVQEVVTLQKKYLIYLD